MTRGQFWALSIISALLVLSLFGHLFLSRANKQLRQELSLRRAYINNARQLQPVLENVVRRIAAAGEKDVKLKALLTKYDIRINLPPESPAAQTEGP